MSLDWFSKRLSETLDRRANWPRHQLIRYVHIAEFTLSLPLTPSSSKFILTYFSRTCLRQQACEEKAALVNGAA